ncbi:MAG: hypothetical protein PVH54_04140 [Gammaproteobacteria bacterium]|jgi:hypothetical protein
MPDIKKVIQNPDSPGPQRSDRRLVLDDRDEAQARSTAEGDKGEEAWLTDIPLTC